MAIIDWDEGREAVKTTAGSILDNRFLSEEQYKVANSTFGDTTGDATNWIDMTGVTFMSAVWIDSAFAGTIAIEISNSISNPGTGQTVTALVGVETASVTVTAGVNAYLAVSNSGGNDGQVGPLGRWARIRINTSTTDAANGELYVWLRRMQSVRR